MVEVGAVGHPLAPRPRHPGSQRNPPQNINNYWYGNKPKCRVSANCVGRIQLDNLSILFVFQLDNQSLVALKSHSQACTQKTITRLGMTPTMLASCPDHGHENINQVFHSLFCPTALEKNQTQTFCSGVSQTASEALSTTLHVVNVCGLYINKDQTSLSCVPCNKLLLSCGTTVLNNHIVVIHLMEWVNDLWTSFSSVAVGYRFLLAIPKYQQYY